MENWKKEKAGTNNQLFVNRKGSLGPIEGCCGKLVSLWFHWSWIIKILHDIIKYNLIIINNNKYNK